MAFLDHGAREIYVSICRGTSKNGDGISIEVGCTISARVVIHIAQVELLVCSK